MSKLRTLEDVIRDYKEVCKDSTMCKVGEGTYDYKNSKERRILEKEYESLLPENERIAILLHNNLCHSNHTDRCGWYYEMKGVIHDWSKYQHKQYLEKANKLIQSGIDINTMKIVFECLNGSVFNNEI